MLLNFLHSRIHGLTISLLLSCVISQPIHATIFAQEPDPIDIARFTTAALSLPAHLASINHPDSNFYAFATHALKAINEIVSISEQGDFHSDVHPFVIGWFWYDFISIFTSLAEDSVQEKSIMEDSNNAADNKQFITETRYILACIEGALRIAAALHNNAPRTWHVRPTELDWADRNPAFRYAIENQQFHLNNFLPDTLPWNTHELLYRCISLFRTTDLYLGKEQDLGKKILFLLLIAHAYAIYRQYNRTQEESFDRGRAHGFADGAIRTAAVIITEIEQQKNNQAQAAQTRAVIDH